MTTIPWLVVALPLAATLTPVLALAALAIWCRTRPQPDRGVL